MKMEKLNDTISVSTSVALNRHKDHVASCWCCCHLIMEDGTFSDDSRVEYESVLCVRQVFKTKYNPDQDDLHELYLLGQTCVKFEEKE